MKNFYFSRKIYFYRILFVLILFTGNYTSAQEIITEHTSGNISGNNKYKVDINLRNYNNSAEKNGTKVFIKKEDVLQTPRDENAKANASLTLNFSYDESEYYISSLLVFSEAGYKFAGDYYSVNNPMVLNVPTGTYDIITEFSPINSGQTHVIIKEQQSIQANTNIAINYVDATNHFSINAYNENGDLFPASGYFFFQRTLYYNPTEYVTIGDYFFTSTVDGQEPEWNFYINNVSNRYSFIQTLIGGGFPEGSYSAKFKTITGIHGDVSIANNPADWSYLSQKFQRTKVSNDYGPSKFSASTYKGKLLIGWVTSSGGQINPGDDPFTGYVSNRLDGDLADLIVIPAIIDASIIYSPTTGGVYFYMKGNPIYSDGNGKILYGSGDLSLNSHANPQAAMYPYLSDDYYRLANNETQLFPFHPKFSFDATTTPNVIFGNNVPITVTGFENNKLKIANKGRYGETRETDYLATHIDLKQNGTSIFSGYLDDFSNNLPSTGQIEITLNNPNTLIEGINGINTTTISYAGPDLPPTLQHLQFRNANNEVTNIFDSTEGANLRIAAGDFKFNGSGESGYFTYEAGNNVVVSYSKHDQNSWATLSVTKKPEYFQMPAFGDYYEGSLSGIQNQSENTWFDLKVICTDTNGNKQEQIISPAFKINGTLAVENATNSAFSVYPNPFKENLNIKIPTAVQGKFSVKISDLTGRTVYQKSQTEKSFQFNGSFLPKGMYILSIENQGKVISKKIIKK